MYNFFQKCIWIYGFMPQYLWFWIQLLNLSIKFTFTIASNMLTLHFIFYQAYNIILLQVNQLTYLFQDSMICKQISPEYYQQVRQLIYKSFAAQSIVTKILDVSEQEVYRYRYEYTKFNDNNAIIALDPKFNKVVGVIFTKDFLDLAQEVCNEKITYSEGFQFMRQKVLKVIFEDYIKKHPNIKRGEVSYHYSGCVDHQYRNLKLTGNTMIKLFEYNRKCGNCHRIQDLQRNRGLLQHLLNTKS